MAWDGGVRRGGPPLPPSPMTELPPPPMPDVPLPMATAVTAALAGGVSGVATGLLLVPLVGAAALWYCAALTPLGALRGLLLGLGAATAERHYPDWPRSLRWAVGMGLGAIPAALVLWLFFPHPVPMALPELTVSVLGAAGLGLALALQTRVAESLLWRLPLAGLAIGALVTVTTLGCAVLVGRVTHSATAHFTIWLGFPIVPLDGAFIGLALALRLRSAAQLPSS